MNDSNTSEALPTIFNGSNSKLSEEDRKTLKTLRDFTNNVNEEMRIDQQQIEDLKDLEMLNCHALTATELNGLFEEFTVNRKATKKESFDRETSMDISTSEILTEDQERHVIRLLAQWENAKGIDSSALEEFIVFILSKQHNLSRCITAVKRIQLQEKKKMLLCVSQRNSY